jgi:hypothetical protein
MECPFHHLGELSSVFSTYSTESQWQSGELHHHIWKLPNSGNDWMPDYLRENESLLKPHFAPQKYANGVGAEHFA